jgi:hypothetical protein
MVCSGFSRAIFLHRRCRPFTMIYRDSLSFIRSRSQGTPVFVILRSHREIVMRDLKADWRRWTRAERIAAVFIALGMTGLVPTVLFLGAG